MSDRLTPEREAEIRDHLAGTDNHTLGNLAARDLLAELDAVRAERDAFCDRVDTLTAVAKGNKRHVQEMFLELQKAQAEVAQWQSTFGADALPGALERLRKAETERDRYKDHLDHLERTTLPDLHRQTEWHQGGKKRWRARAEKAEARVAELEATSVPDEVEYGIRMPGSQDVWPRKEFRSGHWEKVLADGATLLQRVIRRGPWTETPTECPGFKGNPVAPNLCAGCGESRRWHEAVAR